MRMTTTSQSLAKKEGDPVHLWRKNHELGFQVRKEDERYCSFNREMWKFTLKSKQNISYNQQLVFLSLLLRLNES